jgi:hypothetical protein
MVFLSVFSVSLWLERFGFSCIDLPPDYQVSSLTHTFPGSKTL